MIDNNPSRLRLGQQQAINRQSKRLLPIRRVDEVVQHHPEACRRCDTLLQGEDPAPLRHQMIEIPAIPPLVIEHRLDQAADVEANRAEANRYAFGGIVVSERFSTYNYFPVKQRQLCWAQVIRDLTAIAERPAASTEIGTELLALKQQLFAQWHRYKDGTIERFTLSTSLRQLGRDGWDFRESDQG